MAAKHLTKKKAGAKAAEAAFFSKHRLGEAPKPGEKREVPYKPSTHARAVEVDAAGCSYNPPEDARQDVIAQEVGKEMQKKLKKQLDPVKVGFRGFDGAVVHVPVPHRCTPLFARM